MWSPVSLISHRDMVGRAIFVMLATANGTALTLSDTHIVYVSPLATDPRRRVQARAKDVKVSHCRSCCRT